MNIIIDAIPETVDILGKTYRINTDFRNSILFELLIQDSTLSGKAKMANAINLYFPVLPDNLNTIEVLNATMGKILWFYRCGKEEPKGDEKKKPKKNSKPILCYNTDAEYIYAAYLTQYNIDLQDDNLHWWKFKGLFNGLKNDNKIIEIMGYRSMKIDNKMDKEKKKFYKEMKELYKIPDGRSLEDIEIEFNNNMASMF